jgi:hypothetical protein
MHRMHLKGPWEFEPVAGDHPPPAGRVKLPQSWEDTWGEFRGAIRYRRRFHRPTNLDPHERVWIVFDGMGGSAQVAVNSRQLGVILPGAPFPARFEVTPLLQANNELVVDVAFGGDVSGPGGLWAPVAIEITSE